MTEKLLRLRPSPEWTWDAQCSLQCPAMLIGLSLSSWRLPWPQPLQNRIFPRRCPGVCTNLRAAPRAAARAHARGCAGIIHDGRCFTGRREGGLRATKVILGPAAWRQRWRLDYAGKGRLAAWHLQAAGAVGKERLPLMTCHLSGISPPSVRIGCVLSRETNRKCSRTNLLCARKNKLPFREGRRGVQERCKTWERYIYDVRTVQCRVRAFEATLSWRTLKSSLLHLSRDCPSSFPI